MMDYRPNIDLRGLSNKPVNTRRWTEQDLDDLYPYDMLAAVLLLTFLTGVAIGILIS